MEIDDSLSRFFTNVIEEYRDKDIIPILSSLYFHKSIIVIKKRQLEKNDENCECTTHPGYLVGKSGFVCQEDFMIPVSILKEISNENKFVKGLFESKSEQKVFKKYIAKYINSHEAYISFDKFYSFFVSKERFHASLKVMKEEKTSLDKKGWCLFGQGSSHGCCGNYNGCCYYWHIACYVHDKICTKCEPADFCLPGCKPDTEVEYDPSPLHPYLKMNILP